MTEWSDITIEKRIEKIHNRSIIRDTVNYVNDQLEKLETESPGLQKLDRLEDLGRMTVDCLRDLLLLSELALDMIEERDNPSDEPEEQFDEDWLPD